MAKQAAANLLFIGDLVGAAGRRALLATLPALRERYRPAFVIVNAENAAGGLGITPKLAQQLFAAGVDAITLGNHAYNRREILPYLAQERRILRPYNYLASHPGQGWCRLEGPDGVTLGVVSLVGNLFLDGAYPAFEQAGRALAELGEVDHVVVDFHAEATSEKVALGWFLDGRVTAVVGTHTHVQTADARVLPGGTAYITDVGMTGSRDSVIGFTKEQAISRLLTQLPCPLQPAEGEAYVMGVAVSALEPRKAESIEPFALPADQRAHPH